MTQGYASKAYARSFAEGAEIMLLAGCRGYLLLRPIAGSLYRDAAGCYPVFCCEAWRSLAGDLQKLPGDLVTLTLVTDPFCDLSRADLADTFDIVHPLSDHYIIDLASHQKPAHHHQRKIRQALRSGSRIVIEDEPAAFLQRWLDLYSTLIARRGITGLRRFSPSIFAAQLEVPGAAIVSCWSGTTLLGADWYYQQGERVYAHLSSYSEEGYAIGASYGMLAAAIDYFKPRASVIDLGGVPRLTGSGTEGLQHFKSGWTKCTLSTYLCGIEGMPDEYRRLNGGRMPAASEFFPLYRLGDYA